MSARNGKPNATGRSSGKIGGRAGKMMKPPKGEPWVWLTRELLTSDAWNSLSKPASKFLDFLLIEHMNHAGTENGNLKATYRQLAEHGISERCISGAIAEAEAAGLVDCHRGGMRVATNYRLTFYGLPDGTPPTNRWKLCCLPSRKSNKSACKSEGRLPPQMQANGANLPPQMQAESAPTNAVPSISRRGMQQSARLGGSKFRYPLDTVINGVRVLHGNDIFSEYAKRRKA